MYIFGIHNCDTVKKAKTFFDNSGTNYTYHDFRKDGFPTEVVAGAIRQLGAEAVINKRSTTWKSLSDEQKQLVMNAPLEQLSEHVTLIKRPLIKTDDDVFSVGFKAQDWSK
ncbi:MAG: Spx/MgsR family RNA polymerase-binding regulatory protein [Gammaproteobacteria bacterium]|nr:Spx/MgsR family RNA polymerase-binding regulatory protein [Gammaproteobacteria bacterium]